MKRWQELMGCVKHVMDTKWRTLAISSAKARVTATRSSHHFAMAANGRRNNTKLRRTLPIEHPCDLCLVCIIFCSIIQCSVIYLRHVTIFSLINIDKKNHHHHIHDHDHHQHHCDDQSPKYGEPQISHILWRESAVTDTKHVRHRLQFF